MYFFFSILLQKYLEMLKFIFQIYKEIILNITSTNLASLAISSVAILILYLCKEYLNPIVKRKLKAPVPIELAVVSILNYLHMLTFV